MRQIPRPDEEKRISRDGTETIKKIILL